MNQNSKAGVAGRFKRGDDPRRHKNGRKSKAAIEMSKALMDALTEEGEKDEKFKALAETIWSKAIKGQSWAVDVILDRFMGRVTQPIDMKNKIDGKLTIEVVETE